MVIMNPEEYEQLYLPKLEEEYKQSTEWLRSNSFNTRKYIPASKDVFGIITRLQEFEKHFLTYNSLAQYLDKRGLSSMSKRLYEILNDIRQARFEYQKLYQNALNIESFQLPMPWF